MRNNLTSWPSALSPTPWPRESWNPLLAILTLVGAIAILFCVQLGYIVVAISQHVLNAKELSTSNIPAGQQLAITVLTWTPIAGFLLFMVPRLAKRSLADLGYRTPTRREVAIALVAAVVMTVVVDGTGELIAGFTHRHDTEQAVALFGSMKTPFLRIAFVLLACAYAPFYEELTFRVFVFNALSRYLIVPIAALCSGAFFGLVHASSVPEILTVGVPLMLGGVILAYVYSITKCAWANVITHATFNTISMIGLFFFHAS